MLSQHLQSELLNNKAKLPWGLIASPAFSRHCMLELLLKIPCAYLQIHTKISSFDLQREGKVVLMYAGHTAFLGRISWTGTAGG